MLGYTEYSVMAYHNGIFVGAICCRVEPRGDDPKTVYILTFNVIKIYRKYKIGTQLMNELLRKLSKDKKITKMYLHM